MPAISRRGLILGGASAATVALAFPKKERIGVRTPVAFGR